MSAPRDVPEAIHRRFVLAEQVVSLPGLDVQVLKPRNSDDLISEADYVRDERLPYWADLWASSDVLAAYLLTNREALWAMPAVQESVSRGAAPAAIELGCGLGVPSIAASHVGFDVLATDYYEDALLFAAHNAERTLGRAVRTRMVDWNAMPADLGQFALVFAADVLYELRYAPLLLDAVTRTLAPGGLFVLADQGRVALSSFLELATARGFDWRATLRVDPQPHEKKPSITIYELRHKRL
ncbi:MAG: class I SAM-dependent methyltransferase [Gemmatimonadaceae bacterium]|nr:class I SAM-dependent methyltransferase [Gemmatimonadaceae bacterium]MCW5826785.1 class I SAM-dependent methyltransferase [Gemmatimonadaceae bacterium]